MKSFIIVFLLGMFLYFGAVIYLYVTQDNKIFNRKWAKPYIPRTAKMVYFTTDDGLKLEGAYVNNGKNLPLVLYFGGNANNVVEFLDKTAPEIKNFNFIGFNYPGYSNSEGKPCEKCILKYALEIFEKYKPKYLLGRSLGTSVATYVASNKKVTKLVLITPFDSIVNIAKNKYPFLPVQNLVKYPFNEAKWMRNVKCKVNVLLVKHDNVIPEKSIKNIIKNIPDLGEVKIIDGVNHGNIYTYKDISKIIGFLLNH